MVRLGNTAITISDEYSEDLKNELRELIPQLGSNISFDMDKWYCDKQRKSAGHDKSDVTWSFSSIPPRYQEIAKYYALNEEVQVNTVRVRLGYIAKFLNYLEEFHKGINLSMVDKNVISSFKNYLLHLDSKTSYKENVWSGVYMFFKRMQGWAELPQEIPIRKSNPWTRTFKDKRLDEKYIPKHITDQLDEIYKKECMPLYHRLIYWLLRCIPSRVGEITGMSIDCLKEYGENYVLFIPTWKQNGGYLVPQIRRIYLEKSSETASYLMDLIRKQQKVAENLQEFVEDKGLLFTTRRHNRKRQSKKEKGHEPIYIEFKNHVFIPSQGNVAIFLKSACEFFKVVTEKNKPYKISSHQLRHNGITDRLYEGFSLLEVRDMTAHQGEAMIFNSYHHTQPEKSKEIQNRINEHKNRPTISSKAPVYFRGRIVNLNEETEKRLLKNPRAYRITDGKYTLGICGDITSCQSGLFECLSCNYFIPNADDYEYFEEQIKVWEEKTRLFKSNKHALENAEYNLALHNAILKKIKDIKGGKHEKIS